MGLDGGACHLHVRLRAIFMSARSCTRSVPYSNSLAMAAVMVVVGPLYEVGLGSVPFSSSPAMATVQVVFEPPHGLGRGSVPFSCPLALAAHLAVFGLAYEVGPGACHIQIRKQWL